MSQLRLKMSRKRKTQVCMFRIFLQCKLISNVLPGSDGCKCNVTVVQSQMCHTIPLQMKHFGATYMPQTKNHILPM